MYSSIRINGYRGLDSFRMEGLGRVNLLVGANNSGKTSILECIELLIVPYLMEANGVAWPDPPHSPVFIEPYGSVDEILNPSVIELELGGVRTRGPGRRGRCER